MTITTRSSAVARGRAMLRVCIQCSFNTKRRPQSFIISCFGKALCWDCVQLKSFLFSSIRRIGPCCRRHFALFSDNGFDSLNDLGICVLLWSGGLVIIMSWTGFVYLADADGWRWRGLCDYSADSVWTCDDWYTDGHFLQFDCFWRLVHCWYSLGRHVTIGTPMVIFAVLTVFWLLLTVFDDWYTVGTVLVNLWRLVHQWSASAEYTKPHEHEFRWNAALFPREQSKRQEM